MAVNIFGLGMQAFDQGYDRTQAIRDQVTRRKAGQRLAAGDRVGASQAFASEGMIPEARQMQADQFAVEDREAGKIKEQQAEAAKRAELLIGAAGALKRLPWDENSPTPAAARRAALSHPIFQMAGLSQDQLASLKDEDLSDQSLDMFVGTVKRELEFVKGSDGTWAALDKSTGAEVASGMTPTRDEYKQFDPEKDVVKIPGSPGVSTGAMGGGFDGQIGPLMEREGGFVSRDGRSGAPANLGINQRYNPDVDVKNLTPEAARKLYKERYWDAAGIDAVPPEAQGAVFDAAVNQGPERAKQWWQQSGGDLQRFNELRLQHYRSRPDYGTYGKGWERRVQETGGPTVVRQARPKQEDPPSGYRWTANGALEAIPGGPGDPAVRALGTGSKREFASLRKEFNSLDEVKNFKDVAASYRQVRALASRPNASPADDTALTFSFMKMLDPGSVVREGEFALVGRGAGLPDQIVMQLARVDQGKGLTPTIRARLVETAAQIMLQRRAAYDGVASNYRQIAQDLGVNPDQLVEDPAKWRTRIKPQAGASAARRPAGSAGKPSLDDIFK